MKTVYLWFSITDISERETEAVTVLLNDQERRRADRFRFGHLRRRFIAGRAFLRTVLAAHLQRAPESIQLQSGPHGKPYLDRDISQSSEFSFSRTENYAAAAFVEDCLIGVDLEHCKALPDLADTARTIFDEYDFAAWESLSRELQVAAFYRAWTRKEARGKADGSGISSGPRNIRVPTGPLDHGQAIVVNGDGSRKWLLSDWSPAKNVTGSLVFGLSAEPSKPLIYRDDPFCAGDPVDSLKGSPRVPPRASLVIRQFIEATEN